MLSKLTRLPRIITCLTVAVLALPCAQCGKEKKTEHVKSSNRCYVLINNNAPPAQTMETSISVDSPTTEVDTTVDTTIAELSPAWRSAVYEGWEQTKGPSFAKVSSLEASGNNLFVGTDKGIYRSNDLGVSWIPVRFSKKKSFIAPPGEKILFLKGYKYYGSYISCGEEGVGYYSVDSGKSWSFFRDTLADNAQRTAQAKAIGKYLFTRTFKYGPAGYRIFHSIDNGSSWLPVYITGEDSVCNVTEIAVLGTNLFAITTSTVPGSHFQDYDYKIFRSTDMGASWSFLRKYSYRPLRMFVIGSDLYVSTWKKLYRSSDSGKTWIIDKSCLSPRINSDIVRVGTVLYVVGSDSVFWHLFRSTNNGKSWTASKAVLLSNFYSFTLRTIGSDIFIVEDGGIHGVFHSSDSGRNIREVNTGLPVFQYNIPFCITMGKYLISVNNYPNSNYLFGIFRTPDNGESWERADFGVNKTACNPRPLGAFNGTLFFSTDKGVYRSMDTGRSWNVIEKGLPLQKGYNSIATVDERIFAGFSREGVYCSSDGGNNWHAVNSGLQDIRVNSLAVIDKNLFVGTVNKRVFYLPGGDTSWVPFDTGMPKWLAVRDINVVGKELFANTNNNGVFRYPEKGGRWIKVQSREFRLQVNAGITCGTDLFASVDGKEPGIFRSIDGGKKWGQMFLLGECLAANSKYLFVGTEMSGVWRFPLDKLPKTIKTTAVSY